MTKLKIVKDEKAPALAFDDVEARGRFRGCVVTAARMRWKMKHSAPSEQMIRMVRFVWMRKLESSPEEVAGLHAGILGACMRMGLVDFMHGRIVVTQRGEEALKEDRRRKE